MRLQSGSQAMYVLLLQCEALAVSLAPIPMESDCEVSKFLLHSRERIFLSKQTDTVLLETLGGKIKMLSYCEYMYQLTTDSRVFVD